MRNYLTLIFLLLVTLNSFSQVENDSSQNKPVEPRIISNKQIGGPNANNVKIRGTVFNTRNKGIISDILFKNITTGNRIVVQTDNNGNFVFYGPPGQCILMFQNTNYKKLITDTFTLAAIQELEIIVSLGSKIWNNEDMKIASDTTYLPSPAKN
jgi:hypothetical protein